MVDAKSVKALRDETGVGMMECKAALEATGGDLDQAKVYLRKQGTLKAGARGHKAALEGVVGVYLHTGGKICAMVELNSETDFTSRSKEFQDLAHDLAMHVAATDPRWVSRLDVPAAVVDQEKDVLSVGLESKPEAVRQKILDGKLDKFYKDNCLMEQVFVKDQKVSIGEMCDNLALKVKEKIVVKRFVRFVVG